MTGRWLLSWSAAIGVLMMVLVGCGDEATLDPTHAAGNEIADEAAATVPPTSVVDSMEGTPGQVAKQWNSPPAMALETGTDYQAKIVTNKGEIVIDLFEADAPIAVNNFVFLASEGFYDNVIFHRILDGFVIQTGDPQGTGRGGPGYRFQDEPVTRDYTRGMVAMANAGKDTNGSQFFVTLADLTGRLPKNYTIFGEVIEGMDVVDAIAKTPVVAGQSGERSTPTERVVIESVEIITQ
jgi:cyclophilin family peptidyl-prolyl cis-trans isomerase